MVLMLKPDIWALFNHPSAKSYCDKWVCLVGDGEFLGPRYTAHRLTTVPASHASTPPQRPGAGQAMEDALPMGVILKAVNSAQGLTAAFAAFDQVRRPRTQKLVATSQECGMLYDLELPGCGDDFNKVRHKIQHRFEWIWDKDINKDIEEARTLFLSMRC